MKSIFILLLAFPVSTSNFQCTKNQKVVPACVLYKIEEIKSQPKWNPAAEVNEYNYNGKLTYLFTSDCCDQYIVLYDGTCNYLCAPSGGITGKGDNKCSDFYTKAVHTRLIWKDPR